MKIALPSSGNQVDGHFGHCQAFAVFTVDEKKKIVSVEQLVPPPGCGCKSEIVPELAKMGVKVMLAGGMGQGAVNKLEAHGIQVVRGCEGELRKVVESFLAGLATDSGESCALHGDGGCQDHH
ncbi:MAG TPA: NifB/NifX family molybdenum-iron cluster-binding protein [bacterium]|nr:NifB/NifX family molybdenum-iron cluster-binding protein [bacterium]